MTGIGDAVRRARAVPGVPQARHVAERTVAPYLRADLHRLFLDHAATVERLAHLELKTELLQHAVAEYAARMEAVERHMPAVLNAIASSNGTARLLARRVDELEVTIRDSATETVRMIDASAAETSRKIDASAAETSRIIAALDSKASTTDENLWKAWDAFQRSDDAVRSEMRPHIDTLGWLLQRVETVRAEMMHELRYGNWTDDADVEARIVNPAVISGDEIRLNIGAGQIALDGYANVDVRELPGIDVVAGVDRLPFQPGTVDEIFSSHTVEHFPEQQLRRQLLPYWRSLLKPGGVFRAVVPDLDAMTRAYVAGDIDFEALRSVAYGGQEYDADFHFTGFTPRSIVELLTQAGFVQAEILAEGRPNGDCLECEVRAIRPLV